MPAAVQSWETIVDNHRQEFKAQIDATGYPVPQVPKSVLNVTKVPLDGLLSAKQLEITELGPEVLVAKLAGGTYTAVEVTVRASSEVHAASDMSAGSFLSPGYYRS